MFFRVGSSQESTLTLTLEHLQLEIEHFAHPNRALGMVGQVIARTGMNEDRQPLAVQGEPGDHLPKECGRESQLAGPARMRPDLAFVHPPHLKIRKGFISRLAERARLLHGRFVKIDVGVPVIDFRGFSHGRSV